MEKISHVNTIHRKAGVIILISDKADIRTRNRDFPGGAVVKNPPANAWDMGLSPALGRSHMLWSN